MRYFTILVLLLAAVPAHRAAERTIETLQKEADQLSFDARKLARRLEEHKDELDSDPKKTQADVTADQRRAVQQLDEMVQTLEKKKSPRAKAMRDAANLAQEAVKKLEKEGMVPGRELGELILGKVGDLIDDLVDNKEIDIYDLADFIQLQRCIIKELIMRTQPRLARQKALIDQVKQLESDLKRLERNIPPGSLALPFAQKATNAAKQALDAVEEAAKIRDIGQIKQLLDQAVQALQGAGREAYEIAVALHRRALSKSIESSAEGLDVCPR